MSLKQTLNFKVTFYNVDYGELRPGDTTDIILDDHDGEEFCVIATVLSVGRSSTFSEPFITLTVPVGVRADALKGN